MFDAVEATGVQRQLLATRDAHEVYARTFGPMHPATLEAVELMRHLHG